MRSARAIVGLNWALVLLGIAVIVAARGPLLARHGERKRGDDVSLLLSPEHTVVFSLGHREALADYLFATLLVNYGTSFEEKQPFAATYKYLDTITTLAPKYERPYLFADTLLTMRPTPPTLEDYVGARRIQERGLEHLPYFTELWSVAGQFAAYLAPGYLPEQYRAEFRQAGARYLARACELANNNQNIPYHCITAARLLKNSGQREAMTRMLSSTLAVNDDPEIRRLALAFLERAAKDQTRERSVRRSQALTALWKKTFPHASRNMLSLLGPGPDVWRCAGISAARSPGCYTNWRDWGEATDRSAQQ